ncbi:hypothetical protein JTB14_031790 [Gonioctena quinquepunctata]|nr:hypothetical protein JTB14_031790 [Gonioctena quinquepunctata]
MSILPEGGFTYLEKRREELLVVYYANINAQHLHPNHSILNEYLEEYTNGTTITRPARIRFAEQLHEIHFQPPPTITIGPAEIAPWLYTKPDIRFDLASYQKSHTSPIQYRMELNKLIASFQESTIIHTDGSKTNNGVGSSFVITEPAHYWNIPCQSTIFTAEQRKYTNKEKNSHLYGYPDMLVSEEKRKQILQQKWALTNTKLMQTS